MIRLVLVSAAAGFGGFCLAYLISVAVLMPKRGRRHTERPIRDLCKRGCGVVHGLTCGSGTIIDGLPMHCERAYCHRGEHEAGQGAEFYHWPNRDEGEDAVERTIHGPPFRKMLL